MITLKLPLTDEEFMRIASENEEWHFESTKDGELVIMGLMGGIQVDVTLRLVLN